MEARDLAPARSDEVLDLNEAIIQSVYEPTVSGFCAVPAHYLILTQSGKPVYSLNGSEVEYVEYLAITQTLVSFFAADNQLLKSFRSKNTTFVFRVVSPLILVAIDKLHRSETQLGHQLDILHAQILSTLTQNQLEKAFTSRPNMDLRPLLAGTEVFLNALAKDMASGDPVWFGALESLELRKTTRLALNSILVECRTPNMLYGMIVADKQLVGVVRPKKHSLHPADLYLLFSMLFNTTAFDEGEHWVPICLPRFNPKGFLYAYIHFFTKSAALVLLSPDRTAFFELQQAYTNIMEQINKQNLLLPLQQAVERGRRPADSLKVPEISHFLYKSRANVQYIQSDLQSLGDQQTLLKLAYSQLQGYMHDNKLRICHARYPHHVLLAWQTPAFELYCAAKSLNKTALSEAVRRILIWVRRHEERLFITAGATF
ncbi:Vacuolar fusion protein MON1 [Wickerhamiella sorbophila]|uniref:Vacuolar fusion protein MON1 n=1 Tax=Wickerhamiella sorbophila TaxID=45607 RepID=A0A2T0FGT0_9ASCO|nr:Vacuolar fusion protein MON1 [Wickerhamiella sorbophila]XP_024664135.1 Vacuolar fusion protein MON1 [Wickerhamiella sorbophila]PRT53352.1 Vacuolar fusion protein MON1 [Wickerhamiella sorbophila]PRT54190.1 Vacuolar fusion protein MON1 [Wickerhamiella sorbophila]